MGKAEDEENKKIAELDQTAELYPEEENERLKEASRKEVLDQTSKKENQ